MPNPETRLIDEWLVLRAREGSDGAFERLVRRWQEPLWRHAFRLTGREDAAWDVLQEAWISIVAGLAGLREAEGFRRWAYTIVSRRAFDWRRKAGLGPELEEAVAEPADERGGEDPDDSVARALARLPRDRRMLLTLFYVEDFSVEEMAEVLGIPEGTVKSRLHTARRELRERMERTER